MYVCMVLIQWFELQPNQSESFVGRIWNVTVKSVRPLDTHFHARHSVFCDSSLYLSPWTCSHLIKTIFDFMTPECFLSPGVFYSFLPGFYE